LRENLATAEVTGQMATTAARVFLAVCLTASFHWCGLKAQERPKSKNHAIYITHVTVIDTETGAELADRTVVVLGGRIEEVRASQNSTPPKDAKVVDATGRYLIPGLWDMHVHLTTVDATLPLYIANGVTGVREMFGPPNAQQFRGELAAKHIVAPHIYLASPIVDGDPPAWPNSIVVKTATEGRAAVDDQKRKGADFIKIYGGLSRDSYFAILEEARRQELPVGGHVPDSISAWEATSAGQKSIEHLTGILVACSNRQDELMPKVFAAMSIAEANPLFLQAANSYSDVKAQKLFAEFKTNGTWQVPTLTLWRSAANLNNPKFVNDDRLRYFSVQIRQFLSGRDAQGNEDIRFKDMTASEFAVSRELFVRYENVVGAMFRAGVPILAGTDDTNPYVFPGFSLHDELALLVESGMTPLAALQSASRNAATFMQADDRYGSVTKGKIADLVLLDADPLKDIHNTTKVSEVFLAGKEFDRRALDEILSAARQ
jgi:imidazolonepropionase-like amidohydrolase